MDILMIMACTRDVSWKRMANYICFIVEDLMELKIYFIWIFWFEGNIVTWENCVFIKESAYLAISIYTFSSSVSSLRLSGRPGCGEPFNTYAGTTINPMIIEIVIILIASAKMDPKVFLKTPVFPFVNLSVVWSIVILLKSTPTSYVHKTIINFIYFWIFIVMFNTLYKTNRILIFILLVNILIFMNLQLIIWKKKF